MHSEQDVPRIGDWFERTIIKTTMDFNTKEEIWMCKLVKMMDKDSMETTSFQEAERLIFLADKFGYRTDQTVNQNVKDFPILINPDPPKQGWYQIVVYKLIP